eukprot:gene17156-23467_t
MSMLLKPQSDVDMDLFNTPADLVCPITQDLFCNPVLNSLGMVYERNAIQEYLDLGEQAVDPVTNMPLPCKTLTPVFPMKSRAMEYRERTSRLCVERACCVGSVDGRSDVDPMRYVRRAAELCSKAGADIPGLSTQTVEFLNAHPSNAYDGQGLELFANGLRQSGFIQEAANVSMKLLGSSNGDKELQSRALQLCLACWLPREQRCEDSRCGEAEQGWDQDLVMRLASFIKTQNSFTAAQFVDVMIDASLPESLVLQLIEHLVAHSVVTDKSGKEDSELTSKITACQGQLLIKYTHLQCKQLQKQSESTCRRASGGAGGDGGFTKSRKVSPPMFSDHADAAGKPHKRIARRVAHLGASYTVPACSTPGMDLYEDFLKIEKRTMARETPDENHRRLNSDGEVETQLNVATHQVNNMRGVLHSIMAHPSDLGASKKMEEGGGRFKKFFIENIEALQRKLRLPEFHNGFLLLAAEIVEFITEPEGGGTYEALSLIQRGGFGHSALSIWDTTRWVQECYGPTDVGPELPDLVRSLFCDIRTRVEEELGFAHGSLFFQIVAEGGGGVYEDGDMTLVEVFIKAVVELAVQRALTGLTELPSLSAKLVDYLLGYHLDLCFGTHISVLVACCVYAVTKAARADLPFRVLLPEVTDILGLESGSQPVSPIFRSVSISGPGGPKEGQSEEFGDIRTFYNRLFISRVEDPLKKQFAFEPYQADGISEVSGENRNILLAKEKRFRRQKQIPMTIIPDNPEFEGTVPNAMGYPRGIPQPVASQQTQESQETQDEFSFELQNVPTGGLEVSSHAKLPRFLIDELGLTENQPARNYSTIRSEHGPVSACAMRELSPATASEPIISQTA